ncbi:MAG: ABC transporter substrate-binding protein [Nocardioidaceae bacterium]|nr:ABC transporter substrate-binding protein [Nocardioidaceae bacterium]
MTRWQAGAQPARIAAVVLALVAAPALAACGSDSTSTASNGASLTISSSAPPRSIDPVLAADAVIDEVDVALYDNLIDYTADGKLEGRLAQSFQLAPDAKSIDITLRDASFHDGSKVTAEDVKYTLDRIKQLGVGVATQVAEYDSTTVKDDHTLTINLSKPTNVFVGALSHVYILNSKLVAKNAGADAGQAWLANNDAGSGPYELAKYVPTQTIAFKRYDGHWDPATKDAIAQITYRTIAESSTQRDELLAGTTQASENIDPADLSQFAGNKKFTLTQLPKASGTYVIFNTQKGITANPKVREAIRLSYDYQAHLDHLLGGYGNIATGPLPSIMPCRAESAPAMDLAKAKQLVDEAGVSGSSLKMVFQPIFGEQQDAATALQSNLKQIGINLKLQATTYTDYLKDLKSVDSTPDMALIFDNPPTADPGSMLFTRYDSQFVGSSTNFSQYKNPAFDALVEKAITSGDQEQACDLYKQAQDILIKDSVVMYMADHATVVVSTVKFTGLKQFPAHVGWVPQSLRLG